MASYDALSHFTIRAQAASLPFFIVSNVVFIMRSVSRVRYTRQPLGWEDLVLSASWPLNIVRMATFQLALVTTRHVDPADLPGTIPTPAFWAIFTDTWAFLSVTLPKVGVAILLVRVFQPPLWQRKIMLSMAVGLFAYCLAGFGITFAQCRPVAAQWDPFQYPDAACRPRYIMMYYAQPGAAFSAFLDLAFAVYPGIMIWRMHLPTRQKLSTMALMGLGLISFVFATIKTYANVSLMGTRTPSIEKTLFDALHIGLWMSFENDCVMIAACLPPVRALFRSKGSDSRQGFGQCESMRISDDFPSSHPPSTASNENDAEPSTEGRVDFLEKYGL